MNNYIINYWIDAMRGRLNSLKLQSKLARIYPPLISVTFTRFCNLSCKHCLYPQANHADIRLADLARIDQTINSIYSIGVRDLVHAGRTLHKDHLSILKKCQDLGITLHLIDNGSASRLLREIESHEVMFHGGVDISIDGNQRVHEKQRGEGSWQMAIDGIKKLRSLAPHFSITSTASAINYDKIIIGFHQLYPIVWPKILQITTTTPVNHHEHRLYLEPREMIHLLNDLAINAKEWPVVLAIYRIEDLEPIIPILKRVSKPESRYISIEWKINNVIVSFFPQSIITSSAFNIDSNGRHILPFGFCWHLDERPEDWEMRNDLIIEDPKKSHWNLVRKYWATMGESALYREKEAFKDFF